MIQVRVIITGKVQGVGFRSSAQRRANQLGIVGWVRNLDNGSVEILAEGLEEVIEEFVSWCNVGPRGSYIEVVKVEKKAPTGDFNNFARR